MSITHTMQHVRPIEHTMVRIEGLKSIVKTTPKAAAHIISAILLQTDGGGGAEITNATVNTAIGTNAAATRAVLAGERRFSFSGDYSYVGFAGAGSGDGDPVWTIRRITFAASVYVITQTAVAVSWTNRASHTYL